MHDMVKQYPKLLAFLQLFYPKLFQRISSQSNSSDIVEAKLICSNNNHSFQAIVYSEDVGKEGELLDIYTGKDSIAPYSWDWRWVFAIKLLFEGHVFYAMKFKQKVIALPTGKHPLTDIFFTILEDEFKTVIVELEHSAKTKSFSIAESYSNYTRTINL